MLKGATTGRSAPAAAARRRSGATMQPPVGPAPAPTHVRRRRRGRLLATMAASQQLTQLWDYKGTAVVAAGLPHAQALQRRSFGHRNARTYLLVVVDPRSEACRAVESPIEQLAAGLAHERGAVVMALDASDPEAAKYAARILNVGALPAVLVYPEGKPGCLAYKGADMTAEGLLRAVNAARLAALPDARPYELRHGIAPLQRLVPGDAAAPAAAMVTPTPLPPPAASSYWGPGKLALWGGFLALSLLFWAWDKGLDERWEAWQLQRRLRRRRQGQSFTAGETADDLLSLLMLKGAKDLEAADAAPAEQRLGWHTLGAGGAGGGAGVAAAGTGGGAAAAAVVDPAAAGGGESSPGSSSGASGVSTAATWTGAPVHAAGTDASEPGAADAAQPPSPAAASLPVQEALPRQQG